MMLRWERRAFRDGSHIIIGLDEAGRGPLAGPVVAAAVMLNPAPAPLRAFSIAPFNERIDDSKKLSPRQREKAFGEISKKALFSIGIKDHAFIDQKNIYNATIHAMKEAIKNLVRHFCYFNNKHENNIRQDICILVDGNLNLNVPYKTIPIIKGDAKSLSIASASIIAKVVRDRIMVLYDVQFPDYGFRLHKGYGTRLHLEALKKYGPCAIHRKSFAPVKNNVSKN